MPSARPLPSSVAVARIHFRAPARPNASRRSLPARSDAAFDAPIVVVPVRTAPSPAQAAQLQTPMETLNELKARHKLLTAELARDTARVLLEPRIDSAGPGEVGSSAGASEDVRAETSYGAAPGGSSGLVRVDPLPLAAVLAEKVRMEAAGNMVRVRDKLTSRLSKANAYSRNLELSVKQRDRTVVDTYDSLETVLAELESLEGLAHDGARNAPFVVDRAITKEHFLLLALRVKEMSGQLSGIIKTLDSQRIRQVLIQYTGLGSDVRIMGSFDNWSRGAPLSPEHETGSVTTFSVVLQLRPGAYEVKLLCDGEWTHIPELPMTGVLGNNLLTVY